MQTKIDNEYIIDATKDSGIELKRDEPVYSPDGRIALYIYPEKKMIDYMLAKHPGLANTVGEAYMEGYIELIDNGRKVAPELWVVATDIDGNVVTESMALSESSRKNALAMVDEQASHIHFKNLKALQEDYRKFLESPAKNITVTIFIRPAEFTTYKNSDGNIAGISVPGYKEEGKDYDIKIPFKKDGNEIVTVLQDKKSKYAGWAMARLKTGDRLDIGKGKTISGADFQAFMEIKSRKMNSFSKKRGQAAVLGR